MKRPADLPMRIVASTPDAVEARVFLDPKFAGFAGHFPGAPVLPAMCHVDLALRVASQALGSPHEVVAIERARFVRKATPGHEMQIRLVLGTANGEKRTIDAHHSVAGKLAAEIRLRVSPRETAKRPQA